MKKMHPYAQQPIVIDASDNNEVPPNTPQNKALRECFEAAKNNKPLPYAIYAKCSDNKMHQFILTIDEDGDFDFVTLNLDTTKATITPTYFINGHVDTGSYYVSEI